ncbi:hypothetical protein PQJ75_14450 [Rhodoplanes sp. TEM]|uniref:Uncharacterized protein n=1 Tax=Rhodoplanes tepidamans TaxID=200616 RepID=A0ABT5JD08_RHOTP|nr:hypothetical protein [Rhodoplanes tepidamans]MDC7787573.1 hypothetical protein [Rhodoplanes tepidamans]MDC7984934.1 hypothetical protein [Rhodoplanes sp. TEM]
MATSVTDGGGARRRDGGGPSGCGQFDEKTPAIFRSDRMKSANVHSTSPINIPWWQGRTALPHAFHEENVPAPARIGQDPE